MIRPVRSPLLALLLATAAFAQEAQFGADEEFKTVSFEVPAGTQELHISHETLESGAIIDWGVESPDGFRGYGGGNSEDIVIGVKASSRSYLTGPLPAGTWKVYAGKAKSSSGAPRFKVTVTARAAATLAAEPQRRAWVAPAALKTGARWYAGDLHTHSRESGDAQATIDEMTTLAKSAGLDFIELSEHNTSSQLELMGDAQGRSADVLLVPGVELTTYKGHANGIGATKWVDHRVGFGGVTSSEVARQLVAQGAVFSINHPVLDLGDACIGCAWKHALPRDSLGAVEIGTGGWDETGLLFTRQAIAFWDRVLDQGLHVAPVGGSDDHRAGKGGGSPIGNPTTLVWADALSVDALVSGVRKGRTVVKLQGPMDPMIDLTAGELRVGDTAASEQLQARAIVTGGKGQQLRWVIDGKPEPAIDIDADPFEATRTLTAAEAREQRLRAEVWVGGYPRTVTGHLWVKKPEPMMKGCSAAGATGPVVALLGLLGLARNFRKRVVFAVAHAPSRALEVLGCGCRTRRG